MKIILDTNIFFSGYAFDKTVLKLIDYSFKNYNIYISSETIAEIKSKFLDGKMASICKNFEPQRALQYLVFLEKNLIFTEPQARVFVCRDPKDNKFLELAKETGANYLITGDKDLLELKFFETTKILRPSQFIAELNINL